MITNPHLRYTFTIVRRTLFLFVLFFSASTLLFADKKVKERTDPHTFTVQGAGKLILKSNIGDVQLVAGKENTVEVEVKIKGTEKQVDRFKTNFKQDGNTVTVEGDYKRGIGEKMRFGLFRSSALDVKFIVTLPEQFISKISTAGGNITIKGLKNKQEGETSGGDVTVEDCSGELWLSTSGGDMEVRNCNGKTNLRTSGGDITIKTLNGDIEVVTSGGDVVLDEVDGKLIAETSGGKINVRAKENKGMNLKTSGGDIIIKLPSTAKGVLDASTFGGEVTCELPIETEGKIKKTKMKGNINGGGQLMLLKTSGGEIKVESY
ncbi:MAG: DUF4097 family beta strand repeat protein [Ignavibacteriales bacterium]|nr:DUF4097 family beta strand repeat protein [Ignavibacteriales bacterium]